MTIVVILISVSFIVALLIWKVDFSIFINGMWVVPLAPAAMTMSDAICHPLFCMSFISG